jgi:hypothetical protein
LVKGRNLPAAEEGTAVKYMILLYDNPHVRETISADALAEIDAIVKELTDSGELVSTQGLADPSQTKTVYVRDGAPVVVDGPYAEAKEHMGGYLLLDVDDERRAIEIAARWPAGLQAAIEVRPVMTEHGVDG